MVGTERVSEGDGEGGKLVAKGCRLVDEGEVEGGGSILGSADPCDFAWFNQSPDRTDPCGCRDLPKGYFTGAPISQSRTLTSKLNLRVLVKILGHFDHIYMPRFSSLIPSRVRPHQYELTSCGLCKQLLCVCHMLLDPPMSHQTFQGWALRHVRPGADCLPMRSSLGLLGPVTPLLLTSVACGTQHRQERPHGADQKFCAQARTSSCSSSVYPLSVPLPAARTCQMLRLVWTSTCIC